MVNKIKLKEYCKDLMWVINLFEIFYWLFKEFFDLIKYKFFDVVVLKSY